MLVNTDYGVQMSPQDARAWTLKEVIEYCEREMSKCEGEDNWVIIGNTPEEHTGNLWHHLPLGTHLIKVVECPGDFWTVLDEDGKAHTVDARDVENRAHLDVDKYFSFESVKKHCEKLLNEIKW